MADTYGCPIKNSVKHSRVKTHNFKTSIPHYHNTTLLTANGWA